eukprot:240746-Pyramimonas_sp.AAC.1
MAQCTAGVALSRHQRGCAGSGLSPRPLCAPLVQAQQAWHFLDTRGGAQGVVSHRGRYARL